MIFYLLITYPVHNTISFFLIFYTVCAISSFFFSSYFVLIRKILPQKLLCDNTFGDMWSIAHLFLHVIITLAIAMFWSSIFFNVILNLLIILGWELFEKKLYKVAYNFSCEQPINMIGDVVFDILGVGLGYITLFYFVIN